MSFFSRFFTLDFQAAFANMVFTFFGLGAQTWLLYTTKDATTMSIPKGILLMYSISVNLMYMNKKGRDSVIFIPCFAQLLFVLLITSMVIYYRFFPGG